MKSVSRSISKVSETRMKRSFVEHRLQETAVVQKAYITAQCNELFLHFPSTAMQKIAYCTMLHYTFLAYYRTEYYYLSDFLYGNVQNIYIK